MQNLCNRKLKRVGGRHKVYPSNEIHTSFISNLTVTPVSPVTDVSATVLHYVVSTVVTVATTHQKSCIIMHAGYFNSKINKRQ